MAKWIKNAIRKPGALTATARAKGMTPTQFCNQSKDKLSKTSQRRCALMKTLKRFN